MPFKSKEAYKAYQQKYYQSKIKKKHEPTIEQSVDEFDDEPTDDEPTYEPISIVPTPLPQIQHDYLNLYSPLQTIRPNPFGSYNSYQPRQFGTNMPSYNNSPSIPQSFRFM
jgi:hypothetical protein